MIHIHIDMGNVSRVFQALGALPTPRMMRLLADSAEQLTRNRFRTETTPEGASWAPHRPSTLKLRERRGSPSRALLVDSGSLYNSIRTESGDDTATVTVGGAGMFAVVHQQGNPANRMFGGPLAPIPARPFVPDSDSAPAAYIEALTVPIEAAIKEAIA